MDTTTTTTTADDTAHTVISVEDVDANFLEPLDPPAYAPPSVVRQISGEIMRSSRQLLSRISSLTDVVKSNMTCQICLESVPSASTFEFSACKHSFCRDCSTAFLTSNINSGNIYPVCGFLSENDVRCGVQVAREDMDQLLPVDMIRKFEKFKFNKENNNARECPSCEVSLIGDPEVPDMECTSCSYKFCFHHGQAHPPGECGGYASAMAKEESDNRAVISSISRPCPGCNADVEKSGGCNHMKCAQCQSSFCWLCGAEVGDDPLPAHFQWWNLTGCPNMQMDETTSPNPTRSICSVIGLILFNALIFIVTMPPALVLTVAFSIGCCGCYFATPVTPREWLGSCLSGWGLVLQFIYVFAVSLACCPLIVLYLIRNDDTRDGEAAAALEAVSADLEAGGAVASDAAAGGGVGAGGVSEAGGDVSAASEAGGGGGGGEGVATTTVITSTAAVPRTAEEREAAEVAAAIAAVEELKRSEARGVGGVGGAAGGGGGGEGAARLAELQRQEVQVLADVQRGPPCVMQ